MKNTKLFGFIALIQLLLTSCAKVPESLEVILKDVDGEMHTENQLGYINDLRVDSVDTYSGAGVTDESKSKAIQLNWDVTTVKGDVPPKYRVQISETEDFSHPLQYETKINYFDAYNLKVHTKYYWKVTGVYGKKTFDSEVSSFVTSEKCPRNMNIATLSNFRDVGGYSIGNGKFIKQGMVYRSAEFNESYTTNNIISKNDIKVLKNELGIKTDIDLRQTAESSSGVETGGLTSSPLGKDVKYYTCPMTFKGENVLDYANNQESVRQFFDYLADESNYPLVFHCAQGKDRTGCMAYVIEALLGAGDESNDPLLRDYLFTNFSDVNGVCKVNDVMASSKYGSKLENGEGNSLSEKTYNHLMNTNGVSKQTLDKIIDILTE